MQALDIGTEHAHLNTICDPSHMGVAIIHASYSISMETHDIWSIRRTLDKSSKNVCAVTVTYMYTPANPVII